MIDDFLTEHPAISRSDVMRVIAGETFSECRGCSNILLRTGELSPSDPCYACSRRVKLRDMFEPEEDEEDDGRNICIYSENGMCMNADVCGGKCSGTKAETEKCLPFFMAQAWTGKSWERKKETE
jgi:hypothetical protein